MQFEQPTLQDLAFIHERLHRTPRGHFTIARRNSRQEASIIQVAPYVDKAPFPTMYWLVDRPLNKYLSDLEARGVVKELENELATNCDLLAQHRLDHLSYQRERDELLSTTFGAGEKQKLLRQRLQRYGVGGLRKWERVRCLHMFVAAHLIRPNTVGQWLEKTYLPEYNQQWLS